MTQVHSFPPVESPAARVLVLGSMPGVLSLRLQQYYGHPRNVFWKIVGAVLGFDPEMPYAQRTARLVQHQLALWDVLASCVRVGSLDSAIDDSSAVANDFAAFFETHPHIVRVCFNGAKAESVFRRHVLSRLGKQRAIAYVRLPSTSPAHAGMRFEDKLALWRAVDANATMCTKAN